MSARRRNSLACHPFVQLGLEILENRVQPAGLGGPPPFVLPPLPNESLIAIVQSADPTSPGAVEHQGAGVGKGQGNQPDHVGLGNLPAPAALVQGNPPDHAAQQGPPAHAGQQGPPEHAAQNQGTPPAHAGQQGPPEQAAQNQGNPPAHAGQQGAPEHAGQQSPPEHAGQNQGNPPAHAGQQGPPEHAGQQGPPEHAAQNQGTPPEHAGQQGPPDHAGQQGPPEQGPPEHPGQNQGNPPEHAGQQGQPEHAGQGQPEHAAQGQGHQPDDAGQGQTNESQHAGPAEPSLVNLTLEDPPSTSGQPKGDPIDVGHLPESQPNSLNGVNNALADSTEDDAQETSPAAPAPSEATPAEEPGETVLISGLDSKSIDDDMQQQVVHGEQPTQSNAPLQDIEFFSFFMLGGSPLNLDAGEAVGAEGAASEQALEQLIAQYHYSLTAPELGHTTSLEGLGDLALARGEAFDPVALEKALADFLTGLATLRRDLLNSLANLGWYPWLIALAAVTLAVGEYHRRQRQARDEGNWPLTPGLAIP